LFRVLFCLVFSIFIMSTLPIRQLGDPCLRSVCRAITQADLSDSAFHKTLNSLHNTLAAFRASNGFGRGISACQIGVGLRVIALQLPAHQFQRISIINPRVLETSDQKFRLWDDCFSFPDIMVAVERHTAIKLQYEDETGQTKNLGH
jgi:peptide deformylase